MYNSHRSVIRCKRFFKSAVFFLRRVITDQLFSWRIVIIETSSQTMQKQRTCTTSSASARCLLVILLVACLAECGTGSCLSYGHSCWGAHGKRSGSAPSSAPDWYITRMLRRMAALNELNRPRQNDDSDILRAELEPEFSGRFVDEEDSSAPVIRSVDARPMLEDSDIPKMKIWQIMKAAAENE